MDVRCVDGMKAQSSREGRFIEEDKGVVHVRRTKVLVSLRVWVQRLSTTGTCSPPLIVPTSNLKYHI